jgi:uncharacterized protein HemY
LHQAVDVFIGFKNYRNAGACYMNLGCLVTRQTMLEYSKAKEYMDAAIALQEQIIHSNFELADAYRDNAENHDKEVVDLDYA